MKSTRKNSLRLISFVLLVVALVALPIPALSLCVPESPYLFAVMNVDQTAA